MPIAAADDPGLGQRGVDDAVLAERVQQSGGDPEDATGLRDVLAEHDDAIVCLHRLVEPVVEGLDHR